MVKYFTLVLMGIFLIFVVSAPVAGSSLNYPSYLIYKYNPDGECWMGMDADGDWPVRVNPAKYLVGPPPAFNKSGVTIPLDHWVELKFPGRIVDGPDDDIQMVELDPMGEQVLVFLTDGLGNEFLLGQASVENTGEKGPTLIGFDVADLLPKLPFEPSAIRIVGLDFGGGSPGFDLSWVKARTDTNCLDVASNPCPPDEVKNVPFETRLYWSSGCFADSHNVYFGETLADVDVNATPLCTRQMTNFNPGTLELGKTYYWRIDEVNQADNIVWTGDIWQFKTTDALLVEDFESSQNENHSTMWEETGWGRNSLTSNISHGCYKAMEYKYFCRGEPFMFSEVMCSFEPAYDWSKIDHKTLSLYFYGLQSNNPAVRWGLALSDGNNCVIYYYPQDPNAPDDPYNLRKEKWQQWAIDLDNTPEANNVDFSNIKYLYIGFISEDPNSTSDLTGTVYFDDIILYSSFCPQQSGPPADFDCDCTVDFKDLDEMADNWLESGYNILPVAAPAEPVAWYKFDGDTNDCIGDTNAYLTGDAFFEEGFFGQAVKFDGYGDDVRVLNAENIFSKIANAITICFWQKGTPSIHHTDTLFCTNFDYNDSNPAIAINLGCWKEPGRYNWDCGNPQAGPIKNRLCGNHRYKQNWQQQWNHWAFTKDAGTGIMQIFLNGKLIDSRTDSNSPITNVEYFLIGSGWYGGYDGLIDELQIFNYALSAPEIAYTATRGTGIFDLPLPTQADINKDNIVNFTDFAILAEYWLGKQP